MDFARLLQEYREAAGLSQNALARAAGIDPTNLNRIERGKQGPPRRTTIVKLVRAFGWSLADERAHRLFAAARQPAELTSMPSAVLPAPRPRRSANLQPTLRELHKTLLAAVELVARLEELVSEAEKE